MQQRREAVIRAITFDFWDTIVRDDSDEPKRKAQGLASKQETRLSLLKDELQRAYPQVSDADALKAFDHANQWFRHAWKQEHHTPKVSERLHQAFVCLGLERSNGFDELVTAWERMEILTPPDLVDGVEDMLAEMSKDFQLGIISDTIVTPGWGLIQILQSYGLSQYLRVFIFSDEVGAAKPNPRVFHEASRRFGIEVTDLAHVGDREANDIVGPNNLNATSILYTGSIDRGSDNTNASATCHHYKDFPGIIQSLNAS
ncbi:MAG: HAD family hydrolase [Deltaproteobacteria bacterium]|nr:MAG: HAD family hydrolase [Deltaproteobacteria bacterium]